MRRTGWRVYRSGSGYLDRGKTLTISSRVDADCPIKSKGYINAGENPPTRTPEAMPVASHPPKAEVV